MRTKIRFNKLTVWLLTLAMLMTFIPSFTLTASAATITPVQPSGAGTASVPYKISTAAELYWFANEVNTGNNNIYGELTTNIDLNPGIQFTFIPDTGLVEVKKDNSFVCYLGSGILGNSSASNTTFDTTASTAGYVYTDANSTAYSQDIPDSINLWKPIGDYNDSYAGNGIEYEFIGHFDGKNYSISGLFSNKFQYSGLFGIMGTDADDDCSIKNVSVVNSYVCNRVAYTGGICGSMKKGTISGCYNAALICGANNIGGVVGSAGIGTVVDNCSNSGTVYAKNASVGGICGFLTAEIKNCYNTGDIYSTNTEYNTPTGGICGTTQGTSTTTAKIFNCYNTGNVTAPGRQVGGICGCNNTYATISQCYNTGAITAKSCVSGVCGYNNGITIENCYNIGTITATVGDVGGICGFLNQGTITKGHNYGNISAPSNAGSICGNLNTYSDAITNTYYLPTTATLGVGNKSSDTTGYAETRTAEEFADGTVYELLQDANIEPVWGQTIGTDNYPVFYNGSNKPHTHNWKYNAVDSDRDNVPDTITATCTADGCPNTKGGSVIIAAPDSLTYTGEPIEAKVTNELTTDDMVSVVVYTAASGSALTDDEPVNVGTYIASITIGEGDNAETASVTYTIERAAIVSASITVTAPAADAVPQTTVTAGTGYTAAIEWSETVTQFGFNTAYTATVTLTADSNHKFTSTLAVDGWSVDVSTDGTTATLTKTFDATRKARLTKLTVAPADKNLTGYYTEVSGAITELPTEVTYTTESGNVTVDIEWTCDNYDSATKAINTFKWSVKDGELDNYDVNNIETSGSITVTNVDAEPVTNKGNNAAITYDGNTYDVSKMFTKDENAGEASYTITGGTGVGTLDGYTLTITKAGTIEITMSTAANGAYANGSATATLTVAKGTGEGTVTMEGWTYGGTASNPVAESATNGIENVTYLYKDKGAADSTYSSDKPTNAGDYTVKATFAGTDLYNEVVKTADFTIAKAQAVITVDTAPIVKTYGDTWELPTAETNFGTVTIDKTVAEMVNAGTYTVTYSVEGTSNYDGAEKTVSVTINPMPIAGAMVGTFAAMTYNGSEQTPVATVKIGELEVTGTWSAVTNVADTTMFTATDNFVGKIENQATGMLKAASSITTAPAAKTLTYNETARELVTAGAANGGTLKYSLNNEIWGEAIPTGTNAASYEVWYKVFGDVNHNDTEAVKVDVTIAKKKIDSAIVLTAPVKNTAPQTEITGTGYTAAVVWSPEVTDKFGYNKEYTATITITTDDNHTTEGIAADGYTVEGAKTVTNEENSNVITAAYEKTGSRSSSGGRRPSSSNTTTVTTKNEDDSVTKTTTDETTETKTEVTTGTDGSTTTVETQKDGTVTTTEKDSEGNKTVTTEKADGTVITEETKKDGTTVKTETTASGETIAEVKAKGETEVVIPVENADEVTKVVVTDKDGNETEVEFAVKDGGIAVSVSGNSAVSVQTGHTCYAKDYTDVDTDSWYHLNIDYVLENGLMKGTAADRFAPNGIITRAMMVTVLYRAEGEPTVTGTATFEDVDTNAYYAKAVVWGQQNGIIKGYSETEFAPDQNITREQIAAIMHRYAQYKGNDVSAGENTSILSYDDFDSISEYAIASMQYAVGSGILRGKTASTLNPKDNAARAEIAAILNRFIEANK